MKLLQSPPGIDVMLEVDAKELKELEHRGG